MTSKFTPWFRETQKPVRPGVYETRYWKGGGFSKWNGMRWGWEHDTIAQAARSNANAKGASQLKPWRGLKEKA